MIEPPWIAAAAQDIAGLTSATETVAGTMLGGGDLGVEVCISGRWLPVDWWRRPPGPGSAVGAGVDAVPGIARLKAVAEALERSCLTTPPRDVVVATAHELGSAAFGWDEVPACAPEEYAHPDCPIIRFDPGRRMRWVEGFDLADGSSLMVPVTLVHLVPPLRQAERFAVPISTGASVHSDPAAAIVGGCLEVIERDALALNWLTRARLPRLTATGDAYGDAHWSAGVRGVQQYFFDATTDIGVPVAYSLQRRPGDLRVATLVTAAAHLDLGEACRKAAAEAVSTRGAVAQAAPVAAAEDCTAIEHGAVFLGTAEHERDFDFLFERTDIRRLSNPAPVAPRSSAEQLATVRDALAAKGMRAYVVPIATAAVRRLGLYACRVVIPGLMPLSYHYRARFLAHPRLLARLDLAGAVVDQVNPLPQPFA